MGRPLDAREMKLVTKFRDNLKDLQKTNAAVNNFVIACSGGTDSVALLLCAYYVNTVLKCNYRFICVYVDHGLRAVDHEIEFVRELCGMLGIRFICKQLNNKIYEDNVNIEATAREHRYKTLYCTGHNYYGSILYKAIPFRILTAHHRRDQAETVLMGVLGMLHSAPKTVRSIKKSNDGYHTWRPLLDIPREELEYMVRDFKVIEDPTNTDVVFKRNLVRHKVLPALKKILGDNIESIIASKAGE
jgi:tRNA(Ile)-lysidine synthase